MTTRVVRKSPRVLTKLRRITLDLKVLKSENRDHIRIYELVLMENALQNLQKALEGMENQPPVTEEVTT